MRNIVLASAIGVPCVLGAVALVGYASAPPALAAEPALTSALGPVTVAIHPEPNQTCQIEQREPQRLMVTCWTPEPEPEASS